MSTGFVDVDEATPMIPAPGLTIRRPRPGRPRWRPAAAKGGRIPGPNGQ